MYFFEFCPDKCYVKKHVRKEILLQGNLKDGLHDFPKFLIVSFFFCYQHFSLINFKFIYSMAQLF